MRSRAAIAQSVYVTGYELYDRGVGVRVPVGSKILSSPFRLDPAVGSIYPPIQWIIMDPFSVLKRPERQANPSSSLY
jgi:hypothetical protein